MENKERKPKIIAVDRRGYHGVTLTRKAAERYGFERMLRLPGNLRKIEAEALKGILRLNRWSWRILFWNLGQMHFVVAML